MKKQDFNNLLTVCRELNFMGKRKRDTRLEVVEQAISELGLNADASALVSQVGEKLEAEKAKAEKAKRKADSSKPAADTMQGSEQAYSNTLPVMTGDAFLITSAQNNTEVMPLVLDTLQSICSDFGAELVALPSYYNKNSFSAAVESETEYFNTAIRDYVIESDCWLFGEGNVKLAASAAIVPTAKLPINAAAALNGGELKTVVGHPAQQMRTLPSLAGHPIKRGWSTGSCTAYNYTRSRAGSEAEQQHTFGGVLMWISNGLIHETNIRVQPDGSCIFWADGQKHAYGKVGSLDCAIKLGDLHCEMFDEKQWAIASDLVQELNPVFVAVDDILHFSTRSHHNRNDSKHLYATRNESVQNDLLQVISQLNELAEVTNEVYVTESNHNSALDNWLSDSGLRIDFDSHNAKLYHLLKWLVYDTLDNGETDKNALQVALENSNLTSLPSMSDNITFGRMDKPQIFMRHDFSQHGHKGANGSAGSPNQFRQWRLPLVTGHTHSPSIYGNVNTTGVTARLQQGYNRGGASSWDHAHVIEWANGECQTIFTNPQKAIA
tara:strand:+ start:715 stop:2367 length:1653 start_codon:yes stop_codon:yes gene_type:complete